MKLTIEINPKQVEYLKDLAYEGVIGQTPKQVVEFMVKEGIGSRLLRLPTYEKLRGQDERDHSGQAKQVRRVSLLPNSGSAQCKGRTRNAEDDVWFPVLLSLPCIGRSRALPGVLRRT
jgi:hypothetical protein